MRRPLGTILPVLIIMPLWLIWQGNTLWAEQMYSPSWGFQIDLPEGYQYIGGNAFDTFSFEGPSNAMFDMRVYSDRYASIEQVAIDVNKRIANNIDADSEVYYLDYQGREAAIFELAFNGFEGIALCLTLEDTGSNPSAQAPPILLALAYAPEGTENVDLLHFSALNSIAPTESDARYPGPMMAFAYDRGEAVETPLAALGITAMVREGDAEAAQALVDNEYLTLSLYRDSELWQEAWTRFFRAIYRDSWDRIGDAASRIEEKLIGDDDSAFAQNVLSFVQGFAYERDLDGSDFVNLVSAVTEGRGDCDSRAMLWAVILARANIRSAIMVSRTYSHAMGLVDIPDGAGAQAGARFVWDGTDWLVAETTAPVELGRIAQSKSGKEGWIGILFD